MSRERSRNDDGVVAVIVSICAVVLFGIAALVVDISSMYERRRATQTTADLAALAGAQDLNGSEEGAVAARLSAKEYVERNLPPGGEYADLPPDWDTDADPSNGAITITANHTRIMVSAPRRQVDFVFAGALPSGVLTSSTVGAVAVAEIRSPGASLPFFLDVNTSAGLTCLKDGANGQVNALSTGTITPIALSRSAMFRATRLQDHNQNHAGFTSMSPNSGPAGTVITITGTRLNVVQSVTFDGIEGLIGTKSQTQLTVTAPVGLTGPTSVVLFGNGNGNSTAAGTFTFPPPAVMSPIVAALAPADGPDAGGTNVTITGSNFAPGATVAFGTVAGVAATVESATSITVQSPPRGAQPTSVAVTVRNPDGVTSNGNVTFTYIVDPTGCSGNVGNFGYLDIPRANVSGENAPIEQNISRGLDHLLSVAPASVLNLGLNEECTTNGSGGAPVAGAIPDVGSGVDGANCISVAQGNKVDAVTDGFLDGNPARLKGVPTTGTLGGRSNINIDAFASYLPVGRTVTEFLNVPSTFVGEINCDILQSPRFGTVPVLNVDTNPENGFYAVRGFRGVFVDSPDPAERGFVFNNNENKVLLVKSYVLELSLFSHCVQSSGQVGDTVDFLGPGSGPRVPVLIK